MKQKAMPMLCVVWLLQQGI